MSSEIAICRHLRVPISTSLHVQLTSKGLQQALYEARLTYRNAARYACGKGWRRDRGPLYLTLNLKPRKASSKVDLPSDCIARDH